MPSKSFDLKHQRMVMAEQTRHEKRVAQLHKQRQAELRRLAKIENKKRR